MCFLYCRIALDSTSVEVHWSTSTGLSLLLTAVWSKSLECCNKTKSLPTLWSSSWFISFFLVHHTTVWSWENMIASTIVSQFRSCTFLGWAIIQRKWKKSSSKPLPESYYICVWFILPSSSRPSLTPTTTPRTLTMISLFWGCPPQHSILPVCHLCAWCPPPAASPLEPNVSPLDGAGLE